MDINFLHFLSPHIRSEFFFLAVPLIALGEFGLPLPIFVESALLYAGFQISQGHYIYFFAPLLTILGSSIGGSLLYLLSNLFGDKILGRYKIFKERRRRVEETLKKYKGWEVWGVTLLRLTPGFLIPTTIAAGILEVSYFKFLAGVVLSGLVYNLIFLTLGIVLGKNISLITPHTSLLLKIGLFLAGVAIAVIFLLWLTSANKSKKNH
jgi:membrane protein DedA with SNARE-associated domain